MIELSPEFKKKIVGLWDERGRDWIERFPEILKSALDKWSLAIEFIIPDPSYNFIAFIRMETGEKAVLKLAVSGAELALEEKALQALGNARPYLSAQTIEFDLKLGALLLRQLVPGRQLFEIGETDETLRIVARLMRDLPVPVPENGDFPTIEKLAQVFERTRRLSHNPIPRQFLDRAEQLYRDLEKTKTGDMLLHGDLHHYNILYDENHGWVAIDPKGVVGDPAYEAARFFRNPLPYFMDSRRPKKAIEARMRIFSEVMNQDPERLIGWAYVDNMFGACWDAEDSTADFEYSAAIAEILESLLS